MSKREFEQDFKQLLESDLYLFSKYCLEYNQESYLDLKFHYPMSLFLSLDNITRKQIQAPRSFLKTTLAVEDNAVWRAVKRPDSERILFRCDVIDNAMKSIARVKSYFQNSEMLQRIFPRVIPDFNSKSVRWSDKCAEVKRKHKWPEGTFQAAGRGTKLVHQHFTTYFEDDLLVPKKDDLTGNEMIPSRDDVEKSIGAHRLAEPLLVNPACEIVNVQNRWSEWDLVRHIKDNEPWFVRYEKNCIEEPERWPDSEPTYPSRFSIDILKGIEERAGSYVFSTQYLGKPYDVQKLAFRLDWLKTYRECPENVNTYIVTDASLGETKYADYAVAMVTSIDPGGNLYVRHYVRGHFDPREFIDHVERLYQIYEAVCVGIEKFAMDKTIGFFLAEKSQIRVEPVSRNQRESKDWHIRSLIVPCRDGKVFIKDDMYELRTEFVEYPGKTDDLLDAFADIFKIASYPLEKEKVPEKGMFQLETILEELRNRRSGGLPFEYQLREEELEEVI